jgi:hypothetical protein
MKKNHELNMWVSQMESTKSIVKAKMKRVNNLELKLITLEKKTKG